MQKCKERLDYLDALRGILLIFMIGYHYLFNLEYFFGYSTPIFSFPINLIPPVVSALFLVISGISVTFSRNPVKRGLLVLFWAMVITLVSYQVEPAAPITFGILHCIGLMMLLSVPLSRLGKTPSLIAFLLFFLLGHLFLQLYVSVPWLFFAGLRSPAYGALDYYPIFPHGAYFIMGMIIVRFGTLERFSFPVRGRIMKGTAWLGRQSLKVYLLHQPLFFGVYYLLTLIRN